MKVHQGFVEAAGHQLAYLSVNAHRADPAEPAIVFIHGVLASVNSWLDAVPPAFRNDRAWYALSLPAHHPSTVPADFSPAQLDADGFFRIMDAALQGLLGDRPAILVGHSTGGFCAINLAAHQAPNVAGFVSVAGFHEGQWGGVEGQLLALAGLGQWARGLFATSLLVSKKSALVRRLFASLLAHDPAAFRANPLGQAFLQNIEADVLQHDTGALFTLFNGISKLAIVDTLHKISVPCYIFAGARDPVVSAEQSLALASSIPDATPVVFQDVGHMPFVECAEAYFAALEAALADIQATLNPTRSHSSGDRP